MSIEEENIPVPRHIAIIMDGNGRWAQKQGLPRLSGHNAGMKALKETVRSCGQLGVECLTVYAFSTENWKRPKDEVSGIFKIMVHYINKELKELNSENVKVRVIGDWSAIPEDARNKMLEAIDTTADNTGLTFTIALNYGGRKDIVDAVKSLASDMKSRGMSLEDMENLDEETFGNHISTAGMPDPDIIIRTGGEMRLSNFLLWQCAYSEFIFTDVYWPEFDRKELLKCIDIFNRRNRRYGGL